ncbi:MAG: DUF308 domain-containing protein [Akkermansia sp.]|nr:DUF308 domain-containing protein [Akkermansia sp.]
MNTDSRLVRMATSPWLAVFLAVLELLLGFILLSFPFLLGASAVWVGGFVLLVMGLMHLVHVFSRSSHRMWSLLSAVIFLLVGVVMLLQPVASMSFLTLVIGLALLTGGVLRFSVAVAMRHMPGKGWRYFNAIVSLVLGGMVVWSWPGSSYWLIGTIIAVEMIFSGWTLMFMALGRMDPQS